jgi:hypothetical protein
MRQCWFATPGSTFATRQVRAGRRWQGRRPQGATYNQLWYVGRDSNILDREVEPAQRQAAELPMYVRVRDSRNDGSPFQIDDFGLAVSLLRDLLVGAQSVDLAPSQRQGLRPFHLLRPPIDVTMNQNRIARQERYRTERGDRLGQIETFQIWIAHINSPQIGFLHPSARVLGQRSRPGSGLPFREHYFASHHGHDNVGVSDGFVRCCKDVL